MNRKVVVIKMENTLNENNTADINQPFFNKAVKWKI